MSTLEAVAKKAGVSLSTASRILSNGSKYSFRPDTHERVLQACRELGYQPNLPARALASGKTQIIAFAVPRIYITPFTGLGSLQILANVEEACSRSDYHVLISSPNIVDDKVSDSFQNLIRSGYLDGIIVDGHFAIDPMMESIRKHNLPCVVVGYQPHSHFVRADNFTGCKTLLHHLHELGHRHIGIIGLHETLFLAGQERLAGIREAADELGLDFENMPCIDGTLSQAGGKHAARKLVEFHPDLTAILALNDRMALGAVRELTRMGIHVPNDITVVGYDDLPESADTVPSLTTVNQNLSQLGDIAVDMLMSMLDGQEPASVVLGTELIVRESSAPPRKQSI